jgi:hypothetical protein
MSKLFVALALAAATLGAPVLSFAQSSAPLTRAEVRADLIRVEQAGYNPGRGDDVNYPSDVQAAEARIAAQSDQQVTTQGVGGAAQSGTSAAGTRLQAAMPSSCVGPVSYCNIYSGS